MARRQLSEQAIRTLREDHRKLNARDLAGSSARRGEILGGRQGIAVFGGAGYPAEGSGATHFPATVYPSPSFDESDPAAGIDYGTGTEQRVYNLLGDQYIPSGETTIVFRIGGQWFCEFCEV